MKANEAPEKFYYAPYGDVSENYPITDNDIEYIRKDDFTSFYNWSIENGYADNLTLDRINGEGNYEPSNCRWVSYTEQANNMKSNVCLTLNGESHTYAEWGRIVGIRSATLQQRKYAGWSDERTLTTPVRRKSKSYMKGE